MLDETLEKIQQGDLLLMVTERMAESLLSLQEFYDLHPLDVTYFPMKERHYLKADTQTDLDVLERVREWHPIDLEMHRMANEMLTQRLNSRFGSKSNEDTLTALQKAKWESATLNTIVTRVCTRRTKGLDMMNPAQLPNNTLLYWCLEKLLDNNPWNLFHTNRLNSNQTIPYYDSR